MTSTIAMIVPSYGHLEYLRRTISSFHKYSPDLKFVVVDDASPDWDMQWRDLNPEADITLHRFDKNGGLTRSWNKGFKLIQEMDEVPEYTIFGNADILATNGWWRAMVDALNSGYHLTGPLSNAPGVTAKGKQEVQRYVKHYRITDDPEFNDKVADDLWDRFGQPRQVVAVEVNGFFMMGKTVTFAEHQHSTGNVFQPVIKIMPSGRRNPTPLMTAQEDELQYRWRKKGLKSGLAIGSYVFHYRSVARGPRHAKKGWYRCKNLSQPV